ncbi:MAG: AMP-binding protein, partial [Firmicutes bacterium]|nr:AMP-binding protein [Bacillota bacterium]
MKKLKQLKPRFNMDLPKYADLREMLNGSAERFADKAAFIIKHKKSKTEVEYEYITFKMFRDQVNLFGAGLLAAGMQGHTIAISGKNSYPWMQSYFAVVGGLGTCVPLDNGLPYEELESSLARSYSDTFIFDPAKVEMVEKLKAEGKTQVKTWIAMSECGDYPTIAQYMEEGKKVLEAGDDSYLKLPIDPQEVQILLFTSGTTSMAKAVMLSHSNIISNVDSLLHCEDIRSTDVNMAFLPYHHTFGSTGQFCMIAGGAATAYCDGLKYLQKNIVEYKVSLFFCVPLLIESIYKKVMATVKKEGKENTLKFGLKLSQFLLKFG